METVIRVALIYVFILFGLRVMGKREFSQLSPIELVTLLLIPELVSQGLVREDFSITNAVIAVAALFSLVFLTSLLMHKSKTASRAVSGSPSVLVYHGQLIEENLNKERVAAGEIYSEMHKSGLERLEQVRWAVLETDGKIAFIPEEAAPFGRQQGRAREQDLQA